MGTIPSTQRLLDQTKQIHVGGMRDKKKNHCLLLLGKKIPNTLIPFNSYFEPQTYWVYIFTILYKNQNQICNFVIG